MALEITQFNLLEGKQYFTFQPRNSKKNDYPGRDAEYTVESIQICSTAQGEIRDLKTYIWSCCIKGFN